jgi:LAGLIDADG endonuclease
LYNENNLNNRKPGKNMVIYRIRNKSHLKNIIIPIFDKYPLLTNKLYDYMRFKTSLLSDVKYSKDLIKYNRPILSNNSVSLLLNTPYFSA